MTPQELHRQMEQARERIRELQEELSQTQRGLLAMTMELEQRVEQRTASLQVSQAQLQTTLENLSEGVVVCDAAGNILHWNRAGLAMHGFARQEQGPRALASLADTFELSTLDGSILKLEQWPLCRLLRGEVLRDWELRIRHLHDDWHRIFSYSGSLARNAQDRPLLAVLSISNVTERKAQQQALAAAKAAAEEASRAKDHFLAVLSHELRTPLTPVVAALSILQRQRGGFDPEIREHLEMIQRNVDLETRLIDDLLDVTRIEKGKIELDRRPIMLHEVLRRAVEVCRSDIEARRLEFSVEARDFPCIVNADATRLQQVFWNLLRNAIKFTPTGGCVGIRCWRRDNAAIVEVNDSGEGIEPEALKRIFNAFEQAERSITRQFGGLGLGLAISKALVELHGGSIEARSAGKGKGATFRVRLPLVAAEPAAEAPPAAAPSVVRPLRILLVEDHGDTARIMRQLLMRHGHQVEHAGDVATALEMAGNHPFDLLVSDLGLPDASGLELVRQLRARGHAFPAIALSGFGQEDDIRRSKEAGFALHLVKPTDPAKLAEAIATLSGQQ